MNEIEKALNETFLLQKEYGGEAKKVNLLIPLVSVTVATYQQAPYIRQCLDGIIMQQTSFPVEIIIGEDGSTDGTQEICKEYADLFPDKIRLFVRDRNLSQFCTTDGQIVRFNGHWNRMSSRGKYIAWCEGDDYWTDPLKLQKQVDFLENNPEYGMCYTKCRFFNQKEQKYTSKAWGGPYEVFSELWDYNSIPTLTTMFSKELFLKYHDEVLGHNQDWKMGDYPLWLWLAHESKIKFINEVTGVYRILEDSASHSRSVEKNLAFLKSSLEIKEFFNEKFKYGKTSGYFQRNEWFIQLRSYALYQQFTDFFRIWSRGIIKHPSYFLYMGAYKYFLLFLSANLRRKRI